MSVIDVQATANETLQHVQKVLAGVPGGVEKAVKSAMTRTVQNLRTNSGRVIRERYDISQKNIRADENIKVSYTYQNGVQAQVIFWGHKIPLYRYGGAKPKEPTPDVSRRVAAKINGKWLLSNPGVATSGHQLNSTSPTKFDNAFVARMKSGHTGIFERTGDKTEKGGDAIEELMGSSVPTMLGNEEVERKLSEKSMETFEKRLNHDVSRILNGIGV